MSRDYSNYSYYTSGKENGLLKQFTDPNNLVHTITYDQWLRAETSTIGTVGDSRYAKKEFLNYDVRGMFTSLRETTTPSGTSQTQVTQVDRSYDIQGHLYDEKVSLGENAGSLAVATHLTETFDAAGRRVSLARGSTVSAMGAAKAGLWGFSYRADGLLESVSSEGGTFASSYGDNGLLVNRSNPFRTHTVSNRDNRGRVLGANVSLAGASVSLVAEAIGWTNDSKQASYSATRLSSADGSGIATWTDSRAYSYGIQRRQLTSESYIPVSGQPSKSIDYEFDHDLKGGLGIRTLSYSRSGNSLQAHQVGGDANGNGWDAFGRVTYEISGYEKVGLSVQGTALGAKSVSLRVGDNGTLDGVDYPVATSSTSGAWGRNLALPSGGGFTLNGDAAHPSGLFSATASSSFSLAIRHFGVVNSYNAEGSLTARSIAGGFSVGGRSQTLTWDGVGRLVKVVQDETAGFGFTWTAVYDGLNRRIETKTKWDGTATGLGQASQQDVVQRSWYDPQVEFLEVGLQVTRFNRAGAVTSNERWWKVHGPDLSGGYGGLQGMGGLEAMINESTGEAVGMIDDAYGTILGFSKALNPGKAPGYSYSTAIKAFEWNVSRFGGYGPLPGQWAPALEDSTAVWRTYGWRGKRIDVTGFYAMGARYYEPNSGRFISPDPLGHAASMGLYDYAGGDPVNSVDPNGRSCEIASAGITSSIGVAESFYEPYVNAYRALDPDRYWSQRHLEVSVSFGTERDRLKDAYYFDEVDTYGIGRIYTGEHKNLFASAMYRYNITRSMDPERVVLPLHARGYEMVYNGSLLADRMWGKPPEAVHQEAMAIMREGLAFAGLLAVYETSGPSLTRNSLGGGSVATTATPVLRQEYVADVEGLQGLGASARAAGQNAEATARMVSAERNALKLQYRELTPAHIVEQFELRNIQKYGNPVGPSIDQLRASGNTWEQIIESASRSGGADLGF